VPSAETAAAETFPATLARHGKTLVRDQTETLQINVGLQCNQVCRHCHLGCGPDRTELMDRDTVEAVVAYAERGGFKLADVTGGAPELNPHIERLIGGLTQVVPRVSFRANLTAIQDPDRAHLMDLLAERGVAVFASLPAVSAAQTDAQRGRGVFERSIKGLRRLNDLGYGVDGTGLELNLVSNPAGAFLPPGQDQADKRFRTELARRFGLTITRTLTLANVPLGRFEAWLRVSGNYEDYLAKLVAGFNPCAVDALMCRTLVSVRWDGVLFDCDFNLAAGLPLGGRPVHVSDLDGPPEPGSPIAVSQHCYTCTAGAGFT
jgi:radical SAM/Cys-rich protein